MSSCVGGCRQRLGTVTKYQVTRDDRQTWAAITLAWAEEEATVKDSSQEWLETSEINQERGAKERRQSFGADEVVNIIG